MEEILTSTRTITELLLSSSINKKVIYDIGTSYGASFLLKIGTSLDNDKQEFPEWSIHVYECEWTLKARNRSLVKEWDKDAYLDDISPELVGRTVENVSITKDFLKIETLEYELEVRFQVENDEDDDQTRSIASIEYQRLWAVNVRADGEMSVDISSNSLRQLGVQSGCSTK